MFQTLLLFYHYELVTVSLKDNPVLLVVMFTFPNHMGISYYSVI